MIIRAAERRTTSTPNATMTTLASPTLGGSAASLWLVEHPADRSGPWHSFAGEVVWSITSGQALLEHDGARHVLEPGDTVVLAGGELRRLTGGPEGFTAVVTLAGGREVTRDDGTSAGVPPWVA